MSTNFKEKQSEVAERFQWRKHMHQAASVFHSPKSSVSVQHR